MYRKLNSTVIGASIAKILEICQLIGNSLQGRRIIFFDKLRPPTGIWRFANTPERLSFHETHEKKIFLGPEAATRRETSP